MSVSDASDTAAGTAALPLSRQIRNALVGRIVSGEIAAGERLVETKLAADFGTSQAPVREALRELEGIGMVEVKPRRGAFVRPFVQQTLRESYVVRAALEETATRLVMASGSLPLEELEGDLRAMRRAAEEGDASGVGAASVAFHRHIVQAAQNGLLLRAWESLEIEARTAVTLLAVDLDLGTLAEDHRRLVDVMRSGDLDDACRHARDHQWQLADLPHDAHGRPRARG